MIWYNKEAKKKNGDFFTFFSRIICDSRFISVLLANKTYYVFFLHFIWNSVQWHKKKREYIAYIVTMTVRTIVTRYTINSQIICVQRFRTEHEIKHKKDITCYIRE